MPDELISIQGRPYRLAVQPGLFLVRFCFVPEDDTGLEFRVDIYRSFGHKDESRSDLLPPLKDRSPRDQRAYAIQRVTDFLEGFEVFWTRDSAEPNLRIFTYGESDVT